MPPPTWLSPLGALLLLALCCACSRKEIEREEGSLTDSARAAAVTKGEAVAPAVSPFQNSTTLTIGGPELIAQIRASGAKGTIVNAWASWCGPCRREFPMLVALRDSLSAQKIDFVFVSVDEPETYGAAVDFATTRGVEAPILVADRPLGPFKSALSPQWPGMLPATFLFDDQGKLRYFWGGPVYEEELLPIVERYLAGEEVDGYAKVPLRRGKDFRQD